MKSNHVGGGRGGLQARFVLPVVVGLLFLVTLSIATVGCNDKEPGTSANSPGMPLASGDGGSGKATAPEKRTVEQVIKDMEAAYRKAENYSDHGQVHRRFTKDGQTFEHDFDFTAAFTRPNKLRLEVYGARVISDGKKFRASVPELANEVLEIEAPSVIAIDDVVRDPQLRDTLMSGPGGPPVQIGLLLTDGTMAEFMKDSMQPPKLIAPDSIDDRACNRVEIDKPEGQFVFWIGQRDNSLRRIELPSTRQTTLEGVDGPVSNVVSTIEFQDADFKPPTGQEAFTFEIPKDAKIVERLEVQSANIAVASEPTSLKLTKLWTAADVKNPGNILVLDDGPEPKILAIDGWRTVVELDRNGKTIARHDLDVPNDAIVCVLRTATDRAGKRYYVGSADRQPQVHLFDENWKRLLSFPRSEDATSDGIGDVQVADLDGSGKLQLYVSYWGEVGVQGVSLDGNRLWSDRSMQYVLHTGVTEPDAQGKRELLCSHIRGTIVPLNFNGKLEKEIKLGEKHVNYIAAKGMAGMPGPSYCALTGSITDDNTAVGFTLDGKELWNYPLPAGVHGRPIEIITSADLTSDATRQWLIAGADGSVHIVAADGKPVDKFNSGSELAGLAGAKFGDKHLLLVSKVLDKAEGDAKGTLEAWLVEAGAK